MTRPKRYDSNHRLLLTGECQRAGGRYEYKWTDMFGRRHSIYARTLDDLRIKKDKITLNRLEGIREPPAGLTLERLYDIWKDLKRGIKDTTHANYAYTFDTFIRPYIGKKLVIQIHRSTIRAFYIKLLDERKLAMGTVENVHTVLHQVLQYAVDDDYLRKNPCDRIIKELKSSYGNLKCGKRESLTVKQEVAFLRYLYDMPRFQHWYPTFFIMANTGMRIGELTGLRWEDIDLDNGFIDINHTLVYFQHSAEGCHFTINAPKTENGTRKIVMTQAVKEAFLMEREYQELVGIKSLDTIDGYSGFVFINVRGHVQNQGALNKAIHRVVDDYNSKVSCDEDKIPHFSCHVLRHTYATRLIESGANIKFVQYQMGHSEIQTTMDIYVSVSDDFKQKEIKSFEDYMNNAFDVSTMKDMV